MFTSKKQKNLKPVEEATNKINLTPLEQEKLDLLQKLNQEHSQNILAIGNKVFELFQNMIQTHNVISQATELKNVLNKELTEKYGNFKQLEDGTLEKIVETKDN